jgi:hypothetical protein
MAVSGCALGGAIGAASALANTLYADPGGVGVACTQLVPCDIVTAVAKANEGDTVYLDQGTYAPATAVADAHAATITVAPGQSRPTIVSGVIPAAVSLLNGSSLSDVDIEATKGEAISAASASLPQPVIEGVVAHSTSTLNACTIYGVTLRDTICSDTGLGDAVDMSATGSGHVGATLRNVTALSSSGVAISLGGFGGLALTIEASNTIARGATADVSAHTDSAPGSAAVVNLDHSSFAVLSATGTAASVTSPSAAFNQQAPPSLTADGHELAGSPTIGAGLVSPLEAGPLDVDGEPRVSVAGTPCQGTDIGADQFGPGAPPAVVSGPVTVAPPAAAIVGGSVNTLGGVGGYSLDYGAAAPGGGAPASFTSAAVQCLGPSASPHAVAIALTGLAPATTYYYRVTAFNAFGTSAAPFTQTFTTPGPVATGAATIPLKSVFAVLTRTVRVDGHGRGTLTARCGSPAGDFCAFAASLTSDARGHAAASKRARRKLTVGTLAGQVASGKIGKLTLQLTRTGLRLLRARHHLTATARGTERGRAGATTALSVRLAILPAQRKRHR